MATESVSLQRIHEICERFQQGERPMILTARFRGILPVSPWEDPDKLGGLFQFTKACSYVIDTGYAIPCTGELAQDGLFVQLDATVPYDPLFANVYPDEAPPMNKTPIPSPQSSPKDTEEKLEQ